MPQLTSVVLKDRATPTPVDHTFVKRDVRDGVGTVIETNGVPFGNSRLSVSARQTPSGIYKPVLKLVVPVMVTETINGVAMPKVIFTNAFEGVFTFNAYSTLEQRNNLVGMVRDALDPSKTLINDTIVKLEAVY